MKHYTVVIERDEDGFYVATCPAFPGCFTQGKTYRQVLGRIRSLIRIFANVRQEQDGFLPEEVGVEQVKVAAP